MINNTIEQKLNNIDDYYLLLGLGKIVFLNDVIEYVRQTSPNSELPFKVGFKIMELLQYRLQKSEREINHIERAKRYKELHQSAIDILKQTYGHNARTIYANIRTLLHNKYNINFSEPLSLDDCLITIGKTNFQKILDLITND